MAGSGHTSQRGTALLHRDNNPTSVQTGRLARLSSANVRTCSAEGAAGGELFNLVRSVAGGSEDCRIVLASRGGWLAD